MDQFQQQQPSPFFNQNETAGINNKTIIIVLLVLLSLSFLGINILTILGDIVKSIVSILGPLITQILSIFGYASGNILTKSADVVGGAAKTGIDIAEDSVKSVGTILKDASRPNVDAQRLDKVVAPTPSESPIQKPITAGKTSWCLVGEYEGKRGCISVNDYDKCLSGQVFASQDQCLLPPPPPRQ